MGWSGWLPSIRLPDLSDYPCRYVTNEQVDRDVEFESAIPTRLQEAVLFVLSSCIYISLHAARRAMAVALLLPLKATAGLYRHTHPHPRTDS